MSNLQHSPSIAGVPLRFHRRIKVLELNLMSQAIFFSAWSDQEDKTKRPDRGSIRAIPCLSLLRVAIKSSLHPLNLDRSFHTKPCLEIPSRSWSAFVVSFKSLSITSSCRLVLLVSKAGGGLLLAMGCVTWADKGLLLLLRPALPKVVELFTAEVWKQSQHYYRCYLGLLNVNNFESCIAGKQAFRMGYSETCFRMARGQKLGGGRERESLSLSRPPPSFWPRAIRKQVSE